MGIDEYLISMQKMSEAIRVAQSPWLEMERLIKNMQPAYMQDFGAAELLFRYQREHGWASYFSTATGLMEALKQSGLIGSSRYLGWPNELSAVTISLTEAIKQTGLTGSAAYFSDMLKRISPSIEMIGKLYGSTSEIIKTYQQLEARVPGIYPDSMITATVLESRINQQFLHEKKWGLINSVNLTRYRLNNWSFASAGTDIFLDYDQEDILINKDVINAIKKYFINLINKIKVDRAIAKEIRSHFINLLFCYVFYALSVQSSTDSEVRVNATRQQQLDNQAVIVKECFDSNFGEIKSLINNKLEAKKGNEIYYIVVRAVNIRCGPGTNKPSMTVLYPNQMLRLIDSRAEWIYVEYFDHIEGHPRMGWVFKKYCARLDTTGRK